MSFFNLFKATTTPTPHIPNLKPLNKKTDENQKKVKLILSEDGTEIEEISAVNVSEDSLKKIPSEYMEQENEDLVRKWLTSIPEDATSEFYQNELEKYQESLAYVTSKLTSTVVNNYTKFVNGLSKVKEVGEDLEQASQMAHRGRSSLSEAKESVVKGGFNIIFSHRKRKTLSSLCQILEVVQSLKIKEDVIEAHIRDKEFPDAVEKLNSLIEELKEYKNINSLVDLSSKTAEYSEMISHKLDDSLLKICNYFEKSLYSRIVHGYVLLGNNTLLIKLDEYYQSTINNLLQKVVLPFILKTKSVTDEKTFKLPFDILIKEVESTEILSITFQSLSVLSDIMINFSKIHKWHQKNDNNDFDDIKKFISSYRFQLWETIQAKIVSLITSVKYVDLKIEDFYKFYYSIELFSEFGSKFSSSDSNLLESCLSSKTKIYFFKYHKSQLDILKSMLQGETWVRLGIEMNYLDENPIIIENNFQKIRENYIEKMEDLLDEKSNENIFQEFSEKTDFIIGIDEIDHLKHEQNGKNEENGKKKEENSKVVFTATSLRILTLFQQYLYSMQIFSSISTDVYFAFCNLFTFYVYSIHSFFSNITGKEIFYPEHDSHASSQLRKTFKVIREYTNKLHKDSISSEKTTRPSDLIYPLPKFNSMIQIDKSPTYGIVQRITAIESLHILFESIENLSPSFHQFLPKSKSKFIDDVITEIENTVSEVHDLILSRTILRSFDISEVPNLIKEMKWENLTIDMGVASSYVGYIEKHLRGISENLTLLNDVGSKEIFDKFWNLITITIMETLVEGYSRVKKCDPMGRNQMKFDLTTIEQSIKKKSTLNSIPKITYVREYIDGYYYAEDFIWEWIEQHSSNYTKNQMISLVNVGAGVNMKKQDLKELISKIEKLDKFLIPPQIEQVIKSPRGSQNYSVKDEKEKEKNLGSKKQSIWGNISGLMNLNKDNQKQ
eukprot:gene8013-12478_t